MDLRVLPCCKAFFSCGFHSLAAPGKGHALFLFLLAVAVSLEAPGESVMGLPPATH